MSKDLDKRVSIHEFLKLLVRSDSWLRGILPSNDKPVMRTRDVAHLHLVSGLDLNNFLPDQSLKRYRYAHEVIYDIIETKLKTNPNFKYRRIFCLSPSTSLHHKAIQAPRPYFEDLSEKDKKQRLSLKHDIENAFLIESSTEALNHVKRCLKIKKDTNNTYIEFFITPRTRFRHHCIIDSNILLTEDYVKTENGIIPDQIIIDRLQDQDTSGTQKVQKLTLPQGIKNLIKKLSIGSIIIDDQLLNYARIDLIHSNLQDRISTRSFLLKHYENMISDLQDKIKDDGDFNDKISMKQFVKEVRKIQKRLEEEGMILNNQYKNLFNKRNEIAKL